MRICIVSSGYPAPGRLEYVFVQQLCHQLTRYGHEIHVVVPQSITKRILRHLPRLPFRWTEKFEDYEITVYSPQFVSLGNFGDKIGLIKQSYKNAVARAINSMKHKPDVVYGHFWHNAFAAFRTAKKLSIPLFVATGEAEIEQTCNSDEEKEFSKYVSGAICVSTKNLDESKSIGLTDGSNCVVIPNAVDKERFHKIDKLECRNQLGLDKDDFIVAFVGGLIARKGPDRVSAAISMLRDYDIKSIFIGANRDGEVIKPDCKGILHCGPVSHDLIPVYLNAADVFVLPTLHEGCCNAIVEAMSCGLPVISSDLPFNYDVLDKENSILIDPMNIREIANAIETMYKDPSLRDKMATNSLKKAQNLTINKRATRIFDFIQSRISHDKVKG